MQRNRKAVPCIVIRAIGVSNEVINVQFNQNKNMNRSNQVWVSPAGGDWKVHSAGAGRASGIYDTKAEAVVRAREIAINKEAELLVQNGNGMIGWRNSYGNDSFPPRG